MPYNTPTAAQSPALLDVAELLSAARWAANAAEPIAGQSSVYGQIVDALDLTIEAYLHAVTGAPADELTVEFVHVSLLDGLTPTEALAQALLQPA